MLCCGHQVTHTRKLGQKVANVLPEVGPVDSWILLPGPQVKQTNGSQQQRRISYEQSVQSIAMQRFHK